MTPKPHQQPHQHHPLSLKLKRTAIHLFNPNHSVQSDSLLLPAVLFCLLIFIFSLLPFFIFQFPLTIIFFLIVFWKHRSRRSRRNILHIFIVKYETKNSQFYMMKRKIPSSLFFSYSFSFWLYFSILI